MFRLIFALTLAALPAHAAGTLEGRMVTMTTLTYDTPDAPLLESRGATVKVGRGVEFGMGPEGGQNGLDVVPVRVEILPQRVELSYGPEAGVGNFWPATFNGYVLRFTTECALFTAARIDPKGNTLGLTAADLSISGDALMINVSGKNYGPDAHVAIDLAVSDCTLS